MYAAQHQRPAQPSLRKHGAAFFAVLAMMSLPRLARSQGAVDTPDTCADPRVQVEGVPSADWRDSVERLCQALQHMKDVDPSVRLRIVPKDAALEVEATLGDGRVALRRVHAPEDLLLTVEALV